MNMTWLAYYVPHHEHHEHNRHEHDDENDDEHDELDECGDEHNEHDIVTTYYLDTGRHIGVPHWEDIRVGDHGTGISSLHSSSPG